MHDTLRIDSLPSEVLSTGIFANEHREGFVVENVEVESIDAAQQYLAAKAMLHSSMRTLLDVDKSVEELLAVRESLRAQCAELAQTCADIRKPSNPDALEDEWQHMSSTLAVESRRAEATVSSSLSTAADRFKHLPATMRAWQSGTIHEGHVRAIERVAETVEEEYRCEFEERMLERADGRTPQQLAPIGRRIARQYERVSLKARHEEAFGNRGVWITPADHGMATVSISTSAVLADAVLDRLRRAYKRKDAEDPRGLYQFMSDTATATLLSGSTDGGWLDNVRAEVAITMPATMLTGQVTESAELPSGQLVDDDTALALAAGAMAWTRLFTHPVSRVVVTADTYQPTASLRRLILHRDRTCRFPGCSRKAHHADVDHTVAWEHGGRTVPDNLAALCRHHHTLKHRLGADDGWQVKQTSPGVLEWIDPTGRLWKTEPHQYQLE